MGIEDVANAGLNMVGTLAGTALVTNAAVKIAKTIPATKGQKTSIKSYKTYGSKGYGTKPSRSVLSKKYKNIPNVLS